MTTPTITRSATTRWVAAVLLVLPALLAVGLIAALTYSLNAEYGMLAGNASGTISAFALGVVVTSLAVVPFAWFAVRIVSPEHARRHVWPIVLGAIPSNGEMGNGSRDGSCLGILGGNGGNAAAQDGLVTDVRARLAASGWTPGGPVADQATDYIKDGRTLVVSIVRDGKTTEVTATFPLD